MSYIEFLKVLELDWANWLHLSEEVLSEDYQFVTARMQCKFPGKYKVVRGVTNGRSGFKLVFKNEQEEILFKLKYS